MDLKTIWQCGMKNLGLSKDGGETWEAVADKAGGFGCLVSFIDTKTEWFGFGNKFETTSDGGATWAELSLPKDVSKVAAISVRTPVDGYLIDDKGILYMTEDGGKTWSSKSLEFEKSDIIGFVTGGFVN